MENKIRNFFFELLFPSTASHMAHLIDDVIELELKVRQLRKSAREPEFVIRITTDTNAKTVWQ